MNRQTENGMTAKKDSRNRGFEEKAHLNINQNAYEDGYERIFGKRENSVNERLKEDLIPDGNLIAIESRREVYELCDAFANVINEYFKKESIVPHNERFLVVSRAVNAYGVTWMQHFFNNMNPEEIMKRDTKEK